MYTTAGPTILHGTLTFNALGNTSATWVIQIPATLTVAALSNVAFINGANPCNVFWEVVAGVSLGANTTFGGNIITPASIALSTGTTNLGGLYALNGGVTLDTNEIAAPNICAFPTLTLTPPPTPALIGPAFCLRAPHHDRPHRWHDGEKDKHNHEDKYWKDEKNGEYEDENEDDDDEYEELQEWREENDEEYDDE